MQVAVSRQLDFGTDTSGLGINAEHSRPAQHSATISDVPRVIPTVQFADVELALVKADAIVPRQRDEVVSRVLNVVVASVALILLSPVFVLVALAIALTSRGSVLYSQVRVGMDRRDPRPPHLRAAC